MSGDESGIKKAEMYKGIERLRMMTYGRSIPSYAFFPSYTSQLYIDCGRGFNETDSIKWNSCDNYAIIKRIETKNPVFALRFDPCEEPAECKVYEVYINGKLKQEYVNMKADFYRFDPQFEIVLSEEEKKFEELRIEIRYKFRAHSWKESLNMLAEENIGLQQEVLELHQESAELKHELQASRNEVQYMQGVIKEIKEYYKMAPKNIVKRIWNHIKR